MGGTGWAALADRLLNRSGIDPRQFRVLVSLFDELLERRDFFGQSGMGMGGLRVITLLYGGLFGILGVVLLIGEPPPRLVYGIFGGATVFVLLVVLLLEAGNSLMNPAEALLLAAQPVRGATWTGAKLAHIARIVFYLVPAMNVAPVFGVPLALGGSWLNSVAFLAAMLAAGFAVSLFCCSIYGWLLWLLPAGQARRVSHWVEFSPLFLFFAGQSFRTPLRRFYEGADLSAGTLKVLASTTVVALIVMTVLGLRALSTDYLVRAAAIAHGGRSRPRAARAGVWVALAGAWAGPGGRAGYAFTSKCMRRQTHFVKQWLSMALPIAPMLALALRNPLPNPFSGVFSPAHFLPHLLGIMAIALAGFLPLGSSSKAAWLFQSVPSTFLREYARGVSLALLTLVILAPAVVVLPFLVWFWGWADSGLFLLFTLAVSGLYWVVALPLIEGLPFTRPIDPDHARANLGVLMGAFVVAGMIVALQHFLLFPSRTVVGAAAILLAVGVFLALPRALRALEDAMRFQLSTISDESGSLYQEVQ